MDEALRTYIRVVELQSFTKAAEELHISQPAVSLQLKKLEELYETELIYRQAKKFILTATGEILYHRAKQLEGLYKQNESGSLMRKFSVLKNRQRLENRIAETFLTFLKENQ
ncbi:LysR family transcriptional regulator [Listeria monocytogenes]|nr:LysR family transcriptional regulator [Listeria monocytogenes]